MMHGNWYGSNVCPLWGGFNGMNIWHYMLIAGVILALVGIFLIIKNKANHSNDVLEMLKIQYVSGQITEEEYLNRKNVIDRK